MPGNDFSGRNSIVLLSSHTAVPLMEGEKSNNVFEIGFPTSIDVSISLVNKIRMVDSVEIIPEVYALMYAVNAGFSFVSTVLFCVLKNTENPIIVSTTSPTMSKISLFDICLRSFLG